jgi:uncharacterized membrane protein
MKTSFYVVPAIFIITILLDLVYFFFMNNYFSKQVSLVQNSPLQLNIVGALLCYIIISLGLYHFIIKKKQPILEAFLIGLFVYGVYETTNYGLLKAWKPTTVILDTLWGGILFSLVTLIIYKLRLV